MAMMAKMRSLAPAFILTVGALFVLFMIISDSSVLEALGGRSNNVGSINGEKISYQDFSKALDQQREIEKKRTGKDVDEENMDQFRDQVWESIVNQTLLQQQIKKYHLSVSDEEIRNVILGKDPPQFLKQNFIDSTGKFNRQLYERAIFDPRNKEALLQAEDAVRQTILSKKLQSILLASITVSPDEVKRKFIEDNQKLNVEYASVDLFRFPDSSFKISEDDLKSYYNNHLDKYEVKPQRKIKYVLFLNKATGEDTLRVKNDLERVKQDAEDGTTTFEESAKSYSDMPLQTDTMKLSQLPINAAKLIYEAKDNSIVGPVFTREGAALYKLIKTIPLGETQIWAEHILINQFGNDKENYAEAMKIYEELKRGADFNKMAREKSADKSSAERGGDLGWFGKGIMVPKFERAAMNSKIGIVQKPIKTQYGYHIIKVLGKTDKKYIFERIVETVKPSPTTTDNVMNSAQDFSYIANKNDFESEAKLMNYNISESLPFYKTSAAVPGIPHSKDLVEFAFNNDLGDISDALKVSNGYVVAKISEVKKQGVKSFDEVKNQIKPLVLKEKKYQKAKSIAEEIKSKIGDDLEKAKSVYPKVVVQKTGTFKAKGPVPVIGNDYAFIAKAQELPLNKISDPIRGLRGYYLIKVLERTPFDSSAFAIQKNTIRDQIMQQRKSSFFNEWISELRKDADIVDDRSRFYNR